MSDPTMSATVMVARGSTAVTWEVATIVAEALAGLGLEAHPGESAPADPGVPIVIVGQGATEVPALSPEQSRRAVILLLAGPGTQAFTDAAGLAESAAGCFAVSPRTVARLRAQGILADRFVLGHADRWDTRGAADRPRPIDIVQLGELDRSGRRVLARIAPELAELNAYVNPMPGPRASAAHGSTFASSTLLADTALALSLNRWGDTTLDWAAVVRAMCAGTVVIAERATRYGEMVPGEHLLMTRPESIGAVIRASLSDPQRLADIAAAAYELCCTELAMNDSYERLATAASRSKARLPKRHGPARPAVAPRRAETGGPPPVQRLQFRAVDPLTEVPDAGPEVDVICVQHSGGGPISLTRDSLAAQPGHVNLHVGTVERHRAAPPARRYETTGASIAEARSYLVRRSSAPFVMFIESGDEILGDTFGQLAAAISESPPSDIYMPVVAVGTYDLSGPPLPDESRETRDDEAPRRGYIVRRSYLDRIGPLVDGGQAVDEVDHAFWRRAAAIGGRVTLLPGIGLRLWRPA